MLIQIFPKVHRIHPLRIHLPDQISHVACQNTLPDQSWFKLCASIQVYKLGVGVGGGGGLLNLISSKVSKKKLFTVHVVRTRTCDYLATMKVVREAPKSAESNSYEKS